jgi:hypothetical protein
MPPVLVVYHIMDGAESMLRASTSTDLKDKILPAFISQSPTATSKLPGAKSAKRAVMAQDASMECEHSQGALSNMLLGKAAVIDYLAVWCHNIPGWNNLMPIINELWSKQCTRLSPTYHPTYST